VSAADDQFEYFDLLDSYYSSRMYPNQIPFQQDRSLASQFWAPNFRGRSARYWGPYGFNKTASFVWGTSPSNFATSTWYFQGYTIRQYAESGTVSAVTVDYHIGVTPLGQSIGLTPSNFTSVDWWWFNGEGKVLTWDTIDIHIEEWSKKIGPDTSVKANQSFVIGRVCQAIVLLCPSSVTGYTSPDPLQECKDFLGDLPYGPFDGNASKNIAICRVALRPTLNNDPETWCPAMGKLPNEDCTDDHTYEKYYTEDPFRLGFFIGTKK
jgi:hypothetical protein